MESAELTAANATQIPNEQGVYQLLLDSRLVYIGKTDGEAGLRTRLSRHAFTIQHRHNLTSEHVHFRAVRVFVFTAVDLETQLLRHYNANATVAWNDSGFGSNDPGRNRDDTALNPNNFDALYPINIDLPLLLAIPPTSTVASVLTAMREHVPYSLRVETVSRGSRRPHPELEAAMVQVPQVPLPVREHLANIVRVLPGGWQATNLAGRVILYREDRPYPHGEIIAKSNSIR